MRVFGTVKDSRTEAPIKGAKVSLSIGEKELAILYTDSNGEFEHSVTESYIGETLTFYAEKKGYISMSSTYEVEGEEVRFDIELERIIVESWWQKLKKWIMKNKKWIAIGAGIVVVAIIIYIIFRGCEKEKGPDLVISSIELASANRVVNNDMIFKVSVENEGDVEAGPSKLSFGIAGESPSTDSVPPLGPGQTHSYSRRFKMAFDREYLATAIADADDDVEESNEENNDKTEHFIIKTVVQPGNGSLCLEIRREFEVLHREFEIQPSVLDCLHIEHR